MSFDTSTVSLGEATKKSHFDQLLDNDLYLQALVIALVPAGSVIMWGGVSAPSGWLLCNGAAISRTTYSTLYGILTTSKGTFTVTIASPGVVTLTGHGLVTGDCVELTTTGALPTGLSVNTNYYVIYVGADTFRLATSYDNAIAGTAINTSGSQSGTHTLRYCPYGISTSANFLVPDFRGIFPRGAGTSGKLTNANSVAFFGGLGAYQNDKMQGHWHQFYTKVSAASGGGGGINYDTSPTTARTDAVRAAITDGTNGTPRIGTETNPANLGINFIIKT